MREIVHEWIQDRLGIVITMSPEMFANKVKDGHLLSELLRNYEIITDEQLSMIEKSERKKICMRNFQNHIKGWLATIGITIKDEELCEIVDSKGRAALNLFYQVYLELNAKNNLFFIRKQRLNEKLHPKTDRFTVQEVEQSLLDEMPSPKCPYGTPLETAYDIVHWQQDRLEMLLNKCKEAKDEYLDYIRARHNPTGSVISYKSAPSKVEDESLEIKDVLTGSPNEPYEDLIKEKKKAKYMEKFVPDPVESKRIWARLHAKQKKYAENMIFKKDLERNILKKFWERISEEEEDDFTKNIVDILTKQSLYEKQMVQKMGEIKLQKEIMIQNKQLVEDAISKQMEADFVEKLILLDKDFNEKEFTYYLEKERMQELHRKLYEEKLRLKAKRHYNMCLEAVQDVVNVAFQEIDYKEEFGQEPIRRKKDMWRKMFVAAASFDDIVKPVENIVKKPEEIPEHVEEIIHLEIDRQDRIDKKDFESYMNFEWPWELDDIELEKNSLYSMDCGLKVLGSLVHNLLVMKYPFPHLSAKPDFPNIQITACVNGFSEISQLPLLQKILNQREVLVVEMQDAVNFCMNAYKTEIEVEVEVEVFQLEEKKRKGKQGKEKSKKEPKSKKGEKSKTGKANKDQKILADPVEVLPARMHRLVQTPKVYPCEEIPLTVKAELGKVADEELNSGRPLTDHLLVAMFIEYLKSKPDIKGWVLINYPITYQQAALLEQALTGLPVPDLPDELNAAESIYEIAELDKKSEEHPLDEHAELRVSKLLPDPVVQEKPAFYDTALTAYIKVIKKAPEDEDPHDNLPPVFKELENNADPLDRFYSDLGCNYSFYYEKYDFETIKYLAKLVIGDYSIPVKTSVELFGDSINFVNANWATGDKTLKGSTKVGEKKEKPKPKPPPREKPENKEEAAGKGKKGGGKKGKRLSVVIVRKDMFTQIPEVEEEIVEMMEPKEPPKAGEPGWEYTHFPFPEELQVALASLWENAEEVYIEDFGQVFFLNRIIGNGVMPYVNFVKTHMNVYITRPDTKQSYLRDFQIAFNEFDDDLRNDEEFKAELHCKINEMREKLFEICDRRMMEAEQERCDLIRKQWAPKQCIEMVNNYINAFQLELDRFVDSILLATDYYTAVTTKMPNEMVIIKQQLPKLHVSDKEIINAVNTLLENVVVERSSEKNAEVEKTNENPSDVDENEKHPEGENIEEKNPDEKNLDKKNPDEKKSDENNPDANNPDENNPGEKNPDKNNPDGNNPDGNNRDKNNPDGNNPDKNNPEEKNPDHKSSDEKNPDEKVLDQKISAEKKSVEKSPSENNPEEKNDLKNDIDILDSAPFRKKVKDIFKKAYDFVLTSQSLAVATLEKLKVLFVPQPAKGKKPVPAKDKKGEKEASTILTLFEPEEIIRQNSERILEELSCVIRGETARVTIRLNLIMNDLFRNLKEVLTPVQETFHGIFEEIRTRYENEMDSVRKCCMVLYMAVEEEVKIQQELLLKDAEFYINPEAILFPDVIPPITPVSEINKDGVFKIDQLEKIVDILLDLAPSGYIPERCFLFLLQDWIISEDGPVKVPELWANLEPHSVDKLLKQLFDNIEYIQWKDFITYNLLVPFPSEKDLLNMRKEFRIGDPDFTELVPDYLFLKTKLWFDALEADEYRLQLMKRLLLKTYRVRNDKVNYTAMLLDFCKDEDPKVGLAKALELAIGKPVCWNKEIGERFVQEILGRMNSHNEQVDHRNKEMKVNKKLAEEIVGSLIDRTVHNCDSVVICDVNPSTVFTEEEMDPYHFYDDYADLTGTEENLMNYLRNIAVEDSEEGKTQITPEINTLISFEVEPAPALVYFLSLDVLITVITSCLPWHAKVVRLKDRSFRESVEDIYEKCRNPNFNNEVLVHEFLNHPKLTELLSRTSKFSTKNPVELIENILMEQEQDNDTDDL